MGGVGQDGRPETWTAPSHLIHDTTGPVRKICIDGEWVRFDWRVSVNSTYVVDGEVFEFIAEGDFETRCGKIPQDRNTGKFYRLRT